MKTEKEVLTQLYELMKHADNMLEGIEGSSSYAKNIAWLHQKNINELCNKHKCNIFRKTVNGYHIYTVKFWWM